MTYDLGKKHYCYLLQRNVHTHMEYATVWACERKHAEAVIASAHEVPGTEWWNVIAKSDHQITPLHFPMYTGANPALDTEPGQYQAELDKE